MNEKITNIEKRRKEKNIEMGKMKERMKIKRPKTKQISFSKNRNKISKKQRDRTKR